MHMNTVEKYFNQVFSKSPLLSISIPLLIRSVKFAYNNMPQEQQKKSESVTRYSLFVKMLVATAGYVKGYTTRPQSTVGAGKYFFQTTLLWGGK